MNDRTEAAESLNVAGGKYRHKMHATQVSIILDVQLMSHSGFLREGICVLLKQVNRPEFYGWLCAWQPYVENYRLFVFLTVTELPVHGESSLNSTETQSAVTQPSLRSILRVPWKRISHQF